VLTATGQLVWPTLQESAATGAYDPATSIRPVRRFDAQATALYDRTFGSQGINAAGARRSAEFLNWRYADHPAFEYRMFTQHRDRQLTGLAIYRIETAQDTSVRIGRLLEYIEPRDAQDISRSALLDAIIDDARSARAAMLDFFCTTPGIRRVATAHGFVVVQRVTGQLPRLFQPIDRDRAGICFMSYLRHRPSRIPGMQWYVTSGDADQDRPSVAP
jgi:hypothetical protein